MGKESVTPAVKSVPTSGGIKDGGNSILTTPKKETDTYWGSAAPKGNKISK